MKKLLSIDDLSVDQITDLVSASLELNKKIKSGFLSPAKVSNPCVALIFFEPSTRTRISFERAAAICGYSSVLIEAKGSSFEKGETLEDTLLNLKALGVDVFVVRLSSTEDLFQAAQSTGFSIINAGSGMSEHPTQALLDLCALTDRFSAHGEVKDLRGFPLTIVGDLKHSRVLGSWLKLAKKMGIELRLLAPKEWFREGIDLKVLQTEDKSRALLGAQAVMALRVQNERMRSGESMDRAEYVRSFQLCPSDLSATQVFLHPGPINWGVELEESFKSDSRSMILAQVEMGLLLRASLLKNLLSISV